MAITAQQISDIRADIDDQAGTTFTDSEIERAWERVSGASNDLERHEAALALLIRQLMASSAKLVNYRAGAISENRSDVMKHLEKLYSLYKPALDAALGTNRNFAISPVRVKPRQDRTEPGDFAGDGRRRRPRY